MAKYVYKNTHFFITMDPKRTIKMSLKVLYAGWGPKAYHSMTLAGLYISSSPRAVVTGSYHAKPNASSFTIKRIKIARSKEVGAWNYYQAPLVRRYK